MAKRVVARAIAWQVYGGLLGTAAIFAAVAELGWWVFFLYNRSFVDRKWTIIIHASAALCALAVWHYVRRRETRERTLRQAGQAAQLEGRGMDLTIGPFLVRIEVAFLAMVALLGFLTGDLVRAAAFVLSATVAVLAHELGHAEVARRFGQVASIRLHLYGGTTYHMGGVLTRAATWTIAAAGPAAGLLIGAAIFGIAEALDPRSKRLDAILHDAAFVNAGWAALNLLPILPLDGGKLLLTHPRIEGAANVVSAIVAAILAAVGLVVGQPGLTLTFALLAGNNFGETTAGRRLAEWWDRVERRWRSRR